MNNFWYNEAVFYHIYTFSLVNTPFDNDYSITEHKLSEIEKWVPHIKEIGCNAVLFSPVLKSKTHGYDVTDYFEIDNRIGTNDEFKQLVKCLHENGIHVVLDSVFNHCGRDFFAFRELKNGNRDYASWFSGVDFNRRNPLGDPFSYDTWSGYYELVKFNLKNDAVKNYLLDAARFWIDNFDIDGMRLDSANVLDFDFMKRLRCITTEKKPDFWLMGEVISGDYTRWVNNETLHSVTNYMLYKALYSSHNNNNLYELAHTVQNAKPENGMSLYSFLDNHDQSRIASNITDPAFLKTLYILLFTLPGIPSIYYGSEWGITGKKENDSDAPLRPHIDINSPPADEVKLSKYIRRLSDIRINHKAFIYGNYRQIYLEYHRPYIFERIFEKERVAVVVNISGHADTVSPPYTGILIDLLTNEEFFGSIEIPAYSGRILIMKHEEQK